MVRINKSRAAFDNEPLSSEPINIFQTINKNDNVNAPMRLSYHRDVHYNSLVDPHKATIGVGLGNLTLISLLTYFAFTLCLRLKGLPGYSPGSAERNLMRSAEKESEQTAVEKAMMEDKLKHTDWEATNEVIQEQVARESYLQWLKDNERRNAIERQEEREQQEQQEQQHGVGGRATSTVTSGDLCRSPPRSCVAAAIAAGANGGEASPKACCSKHMAASPRSGLV